MQIVKSVRPNLDGLDHNMRVTPRERQLLDQNTPAQLDALLRKRIEEKDLMFMAAMGPIIGRCVNGMMLLVQKPVSDALEFYHVELDQFKNIVPPATGIEIQWEDEKLPAVLLWFAQQSDEPGDFQLMMNLNFEAQADEGPEGGKVLAFSAPGSQLGNLYEVMEDTMRKNPDLPDRYPKLIPHLLVLCLKAVALIGHRETRKKVQLRRGSPKYFEELHKIGVPKSWALGTNYTMKIQSIEAQAGDEPVGKMVIEPGEPFCKTTLVAPAAAINGAQVVRHITYDK